MREIESERRSNWGSESHEWILDRVSDQWSQSEINQTVNSWEFPLLSCSLSSSFRFAKSLDSLVRLPTLCFYLVGNLGLVHYPITIIIIIILTEHSRARGEWRIITFVRAEKVEHLSNKNLNKIHSFWKFDEARQY